MKARTFEGLEQIAAACMTTPDEIVSWHRTSGFPLRQQGKVYVCTDRQIEAWARRQRGIEIRERGNLSSPAMQERMNQTFQ